MAGQTLSGAETLCREQNMFPSGTHVLCAVSGGADSVCLLHWLYGLRTTWGFALTAAHYNHNLRGEESRRDADFVRSFVETCCPDVTLLVGSGDVSGQAARNKTGIEETAREMRYAFLQESARQVGANVIATAHNADDNAETVLLHMIRGSGLRGLTGIQPKRNNIVRPLLTTHRAEIEEYLRRYGLPHVEDSSNRDERFARNRVRRQLLPLLKDMQPQFVDHMSRTARLLAEDEEYLTEQARQALSVQKISDGVSVCAAHIADRPDALAGRRVRLVLEELTGDGGNCASTHLQAVVGLCRSQDPSARVSLPGGILARRVYGELELVRQETEQELTCAQLPLPGQLTLPGGVITTRQMTYEENAQTAESFYLACAKAENGLVVRPRREGDKLSRPGRSGRTLKKILIDEKIPSHRRDTIPVLDCAGQVAAVVGLGPDAAFLPAPGEMCWHITYTSQTEKGSN